ncbi:MAG: PEGA domain-containing protein [Bradymonadales bacterium]|jgi:hypothetical protein
MAKDLEQHYLEEEELRGDEEMHRKQRRTKLLALVVAVVSVLLVVGGLVFMGKREIAEKVISELPPAIEAEMGPPDWVEMELREVEIKSEPVGAAVVVNGVLQQGETPLVAKFAKYGPNSLMLFLAGHEPVYNFIVADAPLGQGLNYQLQKTEEWEASAPDGEALDAEAEQPVDPRYGKVLVKAENPDDEGAELWFDGVLSGKLPVELEQVRRGFYHHVLVKKEGKAPYVAIFRMVHDVDMIALSLKDGVYLDRSTDVWVEPRPKDAKVHIDDKQMSGSLSELVSKGRAVLIQSHLEGYDSWSTTVHTTEAGQYFVRPSLTRPVLGKSLVHWKVPEDKYWYPCLKKPRQSVCWDGDKLREPREIESGVYELVAWEQMGRNVRDKRYAKNKPTVTIEANKAYSFDFDLEGEELILGNTEGVAYDSEKPEKALKMLKIK